MAHKLLVLEWLYKADEDFGFATQAANSNDNAFYDQICLHFHQAVEKYLKAYIVAFDLPFGKTHDLEKLVTECVQHDPMFAELHASAKELNPFYSEARYPGGVFFTATRELAVLCQEHAQRVQTVVREKLGIQKEIHREDIQKENALVDEALKKEQA